MKKILFILLGTIALFLLGGTHGISASSLDAENRFLYPEYSKTISMDFKDAALKDVLKILSQQSGMNFIASDDIEDKNITLYLDRVPVESALEKILAANNLVYDMQPASNIFVVKAIPGPAQRLVTRVYHLKHATVRSSKLQQTLTIEDDIGMAAEGNSSSGSLQTQQQESGIIAALKTALSDAGRIIEDPRTNSLTVTDFPEQFPVVEATLAQLDVPVPQVLIEVEMLDVSKALADQLGIKYGTTLSFTGAQREHYYPWDTNQVVNKGQTAPDYTVGTINASGLSATLEFLKTHTDTKNLARPRILTLNNETAQIKIATDEAIGLKTETSGADSITESSVEAERVETGVILTVTPQASLATNEITMAISPRVVEARNGATFDGTTFLDPEERGSKSILRVHNGDTIMLGGLLRNEYTNVITKLPVLGDIPVVGAAFRHKNKSSTDRELIIFLTPHIVADTLQGTLAYAGPIAVSREQEMLPLRRQAITDALTTIENQRK